MSAQRQIVGIGEAVVADFPDRTECTGLAVDVAIAAGKLGQHGVPITRLGQDEPAQTITTSLRERDIDTSHLQSDPDLPTGRLVVRSIAGRTTRQLNAHAAFDNLQWDFDLVDVAQHTDAVVFGPLVHRGGLSSTTARRFIDECRNAVRLCDVTNRDEQRPPDRDLLRRLLDSADGAVIDETAWSILHHQGATMDGDGFQRLFRTHGLLFAIVAQAGQPLTVHAQDTSVVGEAAHDAATHALMIVTFVHGLLRGESVDAAFHRAVNIVAHAREHPEDDVPQAMRDSPGHGH